MHQQKIRATTFHLKKIGLAFHLYIGDYEDTLPLYGQEQVKDNRNFADPKWEIAGNEHIGMDWEDLLWGLYLDHNTNVWQCAALDRKLPQKVKNALERPGAAFVKRRLVKMWNFGYGLNVSGESICLMMGFHFRSQKEHGAEWRN